MTSLVTGATGFVGRHLVAALANQGQPVRALYRDTRKSHVLPGSVQPFLGDVCDAALVRKAVSGTAVVYHCAAAHSTAAADEMRQTTLPSLRSLIDAMRAAQPAPRLILMSSINVLGNGSYQDATENRSRRKTAELHVDLKIEAEEIAEREIADGLDIVILRPGLIYGPGEPHLPKLASAICAGKFVFIGSRDNVVPLVYISDMVSALNLAAEAPSASGRIYNITDGSNATIGQLVGSLVRVLNCPEPKRTLPKLVPRLANLVCGMLGKSGPVKPSALRFLGSSRHVDITRARTELKFDPKIQLVTGIEKTNDWLTKAVAAQSAA